ncbi:MAG: hypothetical protein FWC66_01930 [Oscillospiraceae bacterium]|nr:hypothetical protein [Oscillospiraceae bacterium]
MISDKVLSDDICLAVDEGLRMWEATMPFPSGLISDRYAADPMYSGENAKALSLVCQCFWLYRKLHEMVDDFPIHATLLGDYFFSIFSKCLVPLDSVMLTHEFARLLSQDTQSAISETDYSEFIRGISAAYYENQQG